MNSKRFFYISLPALLFITFIYPFRMPAQSGITRYPLPAGYTPTQTSYKTDLEVDHLNRIWLGFRYIGLGVFDGTGWVMYNDSNSVLPSNRINCIGIDDVNRIWAGTPKGLVTFDGSNWIVYNSGNSILPDDSILSVYCHQNNAWIGTCKGVVHYNGTVWSFYNTMNSGLINDTIFSFAEDSKGKVYIGTINGLSVFYHNSWTNYDTINSTLKQPMILALAVNSKDKVWIAAFKKNWESELYCLINGNLQNYANEIYADAIDFDFHQLYFNGSNAACLKINRKDNLVFLSRNSPNIWELDEDHAKIYNKTINSSHQSHQFSFDLTGLLWFAGSDSILSFDSGKYQNYGLGLNNENTKNLDCNKVKAMMLNRGDMCWNLVDSKYEVPAGSGKNSIYTSALWIGGLDAGNQLHLAAQTYRQSGNDFWPGPIDTVSKKADTLSCMPYDKIWKLNRYEIEEFIYHYKKGDLNSGTYDIPNDILSWPAHGDGNLSRRLAPFIDTDGDGTYNPMNGDYPSIKGDQSLFWVFNDNLYIHSESNNGTPLGVEIHAMAYSFNCPEISDTLDVINTSTFYHYEIINRSENDYHQCYAGIWTDTDLGNAVDDYIGCDTLLNAGFSYNGDNNDEGTSGYGLNPPVINTVILRGPEAAPNDGLDNDRDGTTDEANEFNGLSHFLYYNGFNNTPASNPEHAIDFYNYLHSIWLDGMHMTYGDDGRNPSHPLTDYMFSGIPYDTTGWTESISGNLPEDRRFLTSSGPFSLAAGEKKTLDFAFVWTRDSLQPNGLHTSIARNKSDLKKIQHWFSTSSFPTCITYEFPPIPPPETLFYIFPNPAHELLELPLSLLNQEKEMEIFDITGRLCYRIKTAENSVTVRVLAKGLYFLRVTAGGKKFTGKFCKM